MPPDWGSESCAVLGTTLPWSVGHSALVVSLSWVIKKLGAQRGGAGTLPLASGGLQRQHGFCPASHTHPFPLQCLESNPTFPLEN